MKDKNNQIIFGVSALLLWGFVIKFLWFVLAFIVGWALAKFIAKTFSFIKKLGKSLRLDKLDDFFESISSYLYNFLPNKLYYIFLLRIPIISGLIFFSLPLISQFVASNFLQNIYVMESGIQLIAVMVFSTFTAIIIISLLKTILVVIDNSNNDNELFRKIRLGGTIILFLPTWGLLLYLNNEKTNIENIGWIYRLLGIVIGIIPFVLALLYEVRIFRRDRLSDPESLRKRRISIFVFEIVLGVVFYILVISLNRPLSSSLKEWHDWQAPTLIYALLIIWVLTLFVGLVTFVFDRSIDEQLDADIEKKTKLYKHTFNWPVILFLIIFSGLGYGFFGVDHYFKLENSQVVITDYQQDFQQAIWNRLCEEKFDIDKKTQTCDNNKPKSLVVVGASGGGIQASGWMSQVLAGLQDEKLGIGEDFTKAISLISSASGGSVGSMFYLNQFENGVLSSKGLEKDKNALAQVVKNATDDWLNSVGWGLAFPDLFRAIGLPVFLNPFREKGGDNEPHLYLDRGYALEKNWQKTFTVEGKKPPTLDDRRKQILAGEIPIAVYNTTLVENGRPFFISPMKFVPGEMAEYASESFNKTLDTALDFKTLYKNCGTNSDRPCDLAVTTAARLSASFPYVTPMARNDRENIIKNQEGQNIKVKDKNGKETNFLQNYHIADGGYYDNAGAFTAINWLNDFLEYNTEKKDRQINITKVLVLQINAFPEVKLQQNQQGNSGFKVVTIGPLDTLAGVRDSTQIARNQTFAKLLNDRWGDIKIEDFTISFPQKDLKGKDYNPPLSWRLTQAQKQNLVKAWQEDSTIRATVNEMKKFWNNG